MTYEPHCRIFPFLYLALHNVSKHTKLYDVPNYLTNQRSYFPAQRHECDRCPRWCISDGFLFYFIFYSPRRHFVSFLWASGDWQWEKRNTMHVLLSTGGWWETKVSSQTGVYLSADWAGGETYFCFFLCLHFLFQTLLIHIFIFFKYLHFILTFPPNSFYFNCNLWCCLQQTFSCCRGVNSCFFWKLLTALRCLVAIISILLYVGEEKNAPSDEPRDLSPNSTFPLGSSPLASFSCLINITVSNNWLSISSSIFLQSRLFCSLVNQE